MCGARVPLRLLLDADAAPSVALRQFSSYAVRIHSVGYHPTPWPHHQVVAFAQRLVWEHGPLTLPTPPAAEGGGGGGAARHGGLRAMWLQACPPLPVG